MTLNVHCTYIYIRTCTCIVVQSSRPLSSSNLSFDGQGHSSSRQQMQQPLIEGASCAGAEGGSDSLDDVMATYTKENNKNCNLDSKNVNVLQGAKDALQSEKQEKFGNDVT